MKLAENQGVQGKKPEIEITPEMIEAGFLALNSAFGSDEHFVCYSVELVQSTAVEVYEAMTRASTNGMQTK
tara:strand:+ start:255 stop:467 length:213 start_codon:yes stop_codon:yes gene_type:complete